ncbi:hypothetical protein HS088_TW20G00058 [Tripterygium wilfordii]|uniref:Uncharacterized protein n=1 Tax=Tripterygium wilfordii TaxID=458696 RepID=A0A7J7C6C6_TRIWF|nr:late embryogenesis abundant protein 6 [Tripterygium wilfordii]KAF5729694.1 hypothetical protein HS088_TW20G00058 [Tripterygium wilfordii]
MQSAMEKLSNIARVAKAKVTICKAKVEEQAEKATARTIEQRELAHERRKAKEARAQMKLHQAKARHAEKKLSRRAHQYNQPVAPTAAPAAAATVPTYPAGGHLPGHVLK